MIIGLDITSQVQVSTGQAHALGVVLMEWPMTRPPTDAGVSEQETDGLSVASGMIVLLIPTRIIRTQEYSQLVLVSLASTGSAGGTQLSH